jgi:hypothetical protein
MKWNDESTAKLKELVYAGKSNKEISQVMGININDVYSKRSQLGITMDKVKNMGLAASVADEELVVRFWDEVLCEMGKVLNAKKQAEKKIIRCDKRLIELSEELQLAVKGDVK